VLAGEPVCPRRRDQENPLLVSDNDRNGRTTGRGVQIRRRSANPLEPFKAYLAARFVDDACLGFCLETKCDRSATR
jgi:hypothetical protein